MISFRKSLRLIRTVLTQSGIDEGTAPLLAKRIVLTNKLAWITALLAAIWVCVLAYLGLTEFSREMVFVTALLVCGPLLNRKGYLRASRLLYLGVLNFGVLYFSAKFGDSSNIHLLYFSACAMPLVIFEMSDGGLIAISVGISILLYLACNQNFLQIYASPLISEKITYWVHVCILPTNFTILLSALYYLAKSTTLLENRLLSSLASLKSRQQQLESSKANLSSIINTIPDVVFSLDPQLRLIAWNHSLETLSQTLQGHPVRPGMHITQALPDLDDPFFASLLDGALAGRKTVIGSWFRIPGAETDYFKIHFSPILNGPEIMGVTVFIQDISERVQQTKAAELARESSIYSAQLASLGKMAAGMAHEINNPLTLIMGNAELLLESIKKNSLTPKLAEKNLQLIVDTTRRISRIITGLKSFARGSPLNPLEATSIHSLFEATNDLCASRYKNDNVALEFQNATGDSFKLECRPIQITQVLVNLLNNAFDAVQDQPSPSVKITARFVGDLIEIDVTDSGPRIPKNISDEMMKPFFTTKDPDKGTGLGLSISKGIIQSHGGSLYFDRDSTQTRFVIRFPKQQSAAEPTT